MDYVCIGFRCFSVYDRKSTGPNFVVIDKPSAPPRPRRGTDDCSLEWLGKDREEIWHIHYRELFWKGPKNTKSGDKTPLYKHSFYPALLVSQAKYNRLLEIADAVAGLALDFAEYNLKAFQRDGKLPPHGWPDKQVEELADKFRKGPTGTNSPLRLHAIP